jgi:DNA-binding Xre family transcriptional regulator
MLWPAWSLRLSIPNCHQRQLRPALSTAVLLVNSRLNLDEAARLAGSPLDGHAVSRILQLLGKHDQWPSIRAAVIRIADYLTHHKPPIDYERRRQLDYAALLPDTAWVQICRNTATPGPRSIRARIARCFLFEQLSGQPTDDAPFALDDNAFRTKVADFPQHLTPELAQALNVHAQEFLADHGVYGEPTAWRPPAGVLDGLDLPGNDTDAVNIAELHELLTVDAKTLGAAATLTGTSLETARYLLTTYPTPRLSRPARTPAKDGRAYCTAKAALPHDRLADLYLRQRISLRDIAATVGVSRQTVTRLARDYGIPLREPQPLPRVTIDRNWLYDQYVTKRRALPDIAKEAGMSTANIARWAKTHAIPIRGRGTPSHSASLAALNAKPPKLPN